MKTLSILLAALALSAGPLLAGNCAKECSKPKDKCCCKQCADPCPNKDCKCPTCPAKK